MNLPHIIFLNGCSSAGKTSLAVALQARLPGLWLHIGVDHFFQMMPFKFHGVDEGARLVPLPDGTMPVRLGPIGYEMEHAFHRAVRAIAEGSVGVIVDDVLFEPRLLDHWLAETAALDVFFVGVMCDLAELERREAARGDRGIGQARWQFPLAHAHGDYDLTVNTTNTPPETHAETIAAALAARTTPSAFERLRAARLRT